MVKVGVYVGAVVSEVSVVWGDLLTTMSYSISWIFEI